MTTTADSVPDVAGPVAPGVTNRLRWRRDATVELCDPVVVTTGPRRLLLVGLSDATREALRLLGPGADEAQLRRIVGSRPDALWEWATSLASLRRANLLTVEVYSGGHTLATMEPQTTAPPPRLRPASDETVALAAGAHLRFCDGAAVLEGVGARGAVVVGDPRVAALLIELASGTTVSAPGPAANGLERAERSAVVGLLGQAGLLAPPAGSETVAGAERTPAASGQWAFADRLFHARTRLTASPGSYGATYPQQGRRPPLPAVKLVTGATIALPVPDEAGVAGRDMALDVALRTRRTVRDYDETRPVTVQELAELLYRCQRILRVTPDAGNGELARRPYPTAGSLQELEVYPVVHRCAGLDAGIYRYDGLGHRLEVVGPAGGTADRLLAGAAGASGRQCAPQVLLVVTARWGRVMWKYESMAYALILKDLGILFQTLYLVATAMGLAPCALGGGESGVLEAAAGLDPHEEGVVGEFMLGGRPAPVRPLSDKPVRNASLFERE